MGKHGLRPNVMAIALCAALALAAAVVLVWQTRGSAGTPQSAATVPAEPPPGYLLPALPPGTPRFKETGRLPIPGAAGTLAVAQELGGRLYLSSEASGAGLHCFALPGHELLWSAHLGSYHHGCEREGSNKEATAYQLELSSDGTRLFAASSGEGTCTPGPLNLTVLDAASGKVLEELPSEEYYGLAAKRVAGQDVLLVIGQSRLALHDQAKLGRVLATWAPEPVAAPQASSAEGADGEYGGDGGPGVPQLGDYAWSADGLELYIALPQAQQLACLRFKPGRSSWQATAKLADLDFIPAKLLLTDEGGLAATAMWERTLYLLERETLKPSASVPWPSQATELRQANGAIIGCGSSAIAITRAGQPPYLHQFDGPTITGLEQLAPGYWLTLMLGKLTRVEEADGNGGVSSGVEWRDGGIRLLDVGRDSEQVLYEAPAGLARAFYCRTSDRFYVCPGSAELEGPAAQAELQILQLVFE